MTDCFLRTQATTRSYVLT